MKRLLFALTLLFGCSSGDDFEGPCKVNETQACACPGGATGAQTCAADGSAWGKCECMPEGSAGMAGSAGLTGIAGAPDKECSTDEDCPTTEAPYCVKFECIEPVVVGGGEDCSERYQVCDDAFTCQETDGGERVCVAIPDH